MKYYHIFRADHLTNRTNLVTTGTYNTIEECTCYWTLFLYGVMNSIWAFKERKNVAIKVVSDRSDSSYRFTAEDMSVDVEYYISINQYVSDIFKELGSNNNSK